jgi:hypothetical protein
MLGASEKLKAKPVLNLRPFSYESKAFLKH